MTIRQHRTATPIQPINGVRIFSPPPRRMATRAAQNARLVWPRNNASSARISLLRESGRNIHRMAYTNTPEPPAIQKAKNRIRMITGSQPSLPAIAPDTPPIQRLLERYMFSERIHLKKLLPTGGSGCPWAFPGCCGPPCGCSGPLPYG